MVKNIVNSGLTGYIKREKLQDRLRSIFQEEIIVSHYNGLFYFDAPRLVNEDEIEYDWPDPPTPPGIP
ncbi:uncharacterized protein BDW47DRAFT_106566, partial [Aspergillus candidus]